MALRGRGVSVPAQAPLAVGAVDERMWPAISTFALHVNVGTPRRMQDPERVR
jgi:hypothetical protein